MLAGRMTPSVLYISYDGVLEPLGESQVVSYLERLAADHAIALLTFEKPEDLADEPRRLAMWRRLSNLNIAWVPQKYHKWPPVFSTAFDIFEGILKARRICRRRRVRIIHARSYVPALIALGTRSVNRAAFLFDMRGFWVDEKVEAGHWARGGLLYRAGKWWEKRFYRAADAVVSLTAAGAAAIPELGVRMKPEAPVVVIPTCADLRRFSPGRKDPHLFEELELGDGPIIGCVGTMGNWYMRQEMIDGLAYLAGKLENICVLIVTRDDHVALRADLERAGVPAERLVITRAGFAEMPRYVRLFDAGLFFIKPSFSKRASAATKMAEFLGCGVPVIINDGVGDSGAIVREKNVGVVLPPLPGAEAFEAALPEVRAMMADPKTGERCRAAALELFDLTVGAERYRELYTRLGAR
jgi:glycosyltransferase involved in cell wall biosynthesis